MYTKLMVPLDGSPLAEEALPPALALSRRTGADVHLVTALEPLPTFGFGGWEPEPLDWGRDYLDDVQARVAGLAGGVVSTHLAWGFAVQVIEREAAVYGADLVVMATHGRGAISRAWLGSVADAFVHRSDLPVLLVRPVDGEPSPPETDAVFAKILIPLDGSELSESVLEPAVALGALFDAGYQLVRVVPHPFGVSSPYLPYTVQMNTSILEAAKGSADHYLRDHAERMRGDGLEVDHAVRVRGQPGGGILAEAEAVDADLIVMASHARKGLSRAFLGSAADKVVRGSGVPVLLYRMGSERPTESEGEE